MRWEDHRKWPSGKALDEGGPGEIEKLRKKTQSRITSNLSHI
jgi:hypothetical protein